MRITKFIVLCLCCLYCTKADYLSPESEGEYYDELSIPLNDIVTSRGTNLTSYFARQFVNVDEKVEELLNGKYANLNNYPRNISDVFRGKWKLNDERAEFNQTDRFMPAHRVGDVALHLHNNPSALSRMDVVTGELHLLHGRYKTSYVLAYDVQGVYLKNSGVAFIVANPQIPEGEVNRAGVISDVELYLDFNDTVAADVREVLRASSEFDREYLKASAEKWDIQNGSAQAVHSTGGRLLREWDRGSTQSPWDDEDAWRRFMNNTGMRAVFATPRDQCYFKMFIQFHPLPAGITNDDWARIGEDDDYSNNVFYDPSMLPSSHDGEYRLVLNITSFAVSPSCGVWLDMELGSVVWETYFRRAIHYAVPSIAVTILQTIVLIQQMGLTTPQSSLVKMSMMMVGLQAVIDLFICLLHLTAGIAVASHLFPVFAIGAFLKFALFGFFEMRYVMYIFRARSPDAFNQDGVSTRRQLSMLYLRFYGLLVLGFVLLNYVSDYFFLFVIFLHSFWIPQIYTNLKQGANGPISTRYVVVTSLTRMFDVLYFYGCPENFTRVQPSPYVGWFVVYMCLQMFVLLAQRRYGARCFIPATFLPKPYDYRRPVVMDQETDCAICMTLVTQDDYLITPCDHLFHEKCLKHWFEEKMICPICRGGVPSFDV